MKPGLTGRWYEVQISHMIEGTGQFGLAKGFV